MTEHPIWRWWLFCLATWLYGRTGYGLGLLGWCVLPTWLASEDELRSFDNRGPDPW